MRGYVLTLNTYKLYLNHCYYEVIEPFYKKPARATTLAGFVLSFYRCLITIINNNKTTIIVITWSIFPPFYFVSGGIIANQSQKRCAGLLKISGFHA